MEDIDHREGEYSIVRLNKNNLKDLAVLHTEVYHSNIANEYFTQKYNTTFTGVEYVGFIAYDMNQRPIAYYGVIPCFIQFNGEKILSAQSGDTMTHPLHRNRGMFVSLSNMTFGLCKKLGINIVFGFPNQNSYPTMIKKLGWIETGKLSRFHLPVNNFFRRFFFSSKTRERKVLQKLIADKKGLCNSAIEKDFGGVYRDDSYFNYKTFSKTCVLQLSCGEVWVKIKESLVIGDIKLNGNDHRRFFKEIRQIAGNLGVKRVTFQVSPGCSTHNLFADYYKAIPSFPVLFRDFGSGIPLEKIKFTFSDIDIF